MCSSDWRFSRPGLLQWLSATDFVDAYPGRDGWSRLVRPIGRVGLAGVVEFTVGPSGLTAASRPVVEPVRAGAFRVLGLFGFPLWWWAACAAPRGPRVRVSMDLAFPVWAWRWCPGGPRLALSFPPVSSCTPWRDLGLCIGGSTGLTFVCACLRVHRYWYLDDRMIGPC